MGMFVLGWRMPGGKQVLVTSDGSSRASALAAAEETFGGEPTSPADQVLLETAKRPAAARAARSRARKRGGHLEDRLRAGNEFGPYAVVNRPPTEVWDAKLGKQVPITKKQLEKMIREGSGLAEKMLRDRARVARSAGVMRIIEVPGESVPVEMSRLEAIQTAERYVRREGHPAARVVEMHSLGGDRWRYDYVFGAWREGRAVVRTAMDRSIVKELARSYDLVDWENN